MMKLDDRINECAIAFAAMAEQDSRLNELSRKYDNDPEAMPKAEFDEMMRLLNKLESNPFIDKLMTECLEADDDDAYADMFLPDDDDPIWNESNVDLFGPWWE